MTDPNRGQAFRAAWVQVGTETQYASVETVDAGDQLIAQLTAFGAATQGWVEVTDINWHRIVTVERVNPV